MYEYFEDNKYFYIITEICDGGELFDRIVEKSFYSEKDAAQVFKQILECLNYCHNKGIAHRDLKPENFLFETKDEYSDVKIIDFGCSKMIGNKTT